jgi:hypothetical protein
MFLCVFMCTCGATERRLVTSQRARAVGLQSITAGVAEQDAASAWVRRLCTCCYRALALASTCDRR